MYHSFFLIFLSSRKELRLEIQSMCMIPQVCRYDDHCVILLFFTLKMYYLNSNFEDKKLKIPKYLVAKIRAHIVCGAHKNDLKKIHHFFPLNCRTEIAIQ